MVKLTKIYTKSGDRGETSLGNGARVPKTDARVESYGTVDEANAAIGVAVLAAREGGLAGIAEVLERTQHDLFDVGADLCTPVEAGEEEGSKLRVLASQTERLEHEIDRFNAPLAALTSFVLPGGTPAAAALHVARTVVRRAERLVTAVVADEADTVNAETARYLNRLSDLLFVLGRAANENGARDVLWVPGATRDVSGRESVDA